MALGGRIGEIVGNPLVKPVSVADVLADNAQADAEAPSGPVVALLLGVNKSQTIQNFRLHHG